MTEEVVPYGQATMNALQAPSPTPMPQAIQLSAYNLSRAEGTGQQLFVKVQGGRIEGRTATHFVCLLDVSGSMQSERRLQNCVDSLKYVARFLTADDRFSLITFSDTAEVRCDCVQMNEAGQAQVIHTLDQVCTLGSTNMGDALVRLFGVVRGCAERHPTLKQGVLLLTDGFVNMGLVSEDGLVGLVHNFMTEFPRATVTAIGYGVDHNRELLNAVTVRAAGTYNIVRDREDVASVFGAVMGSMVSCVGLNLRILAPRGTTIRETRHMEDVEENLTAISLGDVYAETGSSILLTLPAGITPLTQIGMQVYDVTANATTERSVAIEQASTDVEQEARIYSLRQDVAGLLSMIGRATPADVPILIQKTNLYDSDIDALVALMGDSNAILQILKEEIREARLVLERIRTRPSYETSVDISIMGQHARYLSQGGGTRATSGGGVNLTQAVAHDPFMSPLSRHVSGGAAVSVSSMHHDIEDPAFSSSSLGPVPILQTPRRNGGGLTVPPTRQRPMRLVRSIAISGTPPSPTDLLVTRQQAGGSPIPEEDEDPSFIPPPANVSSLSGAIMTHEAFMQMLTGTTEADQEARMNAGIPYPLPLSITPPAPYNERGTH